MNIYANSFYCAFGGNDDEAVVTLFQDYPIPRTGESEVTHEQVGGFVMSKRTAIDLANIILKLCDRNDVQLTEAEHE